LLVFLKYDEEIPVRRPRKDDLKKGYYRSERNVVHNIKRSVLGIPKTKMDFKTIECSIMDMADDIAYSTYDLEDTLKAGFVTPLHIALADGDILERVARKARKALGSSFDQHGVRETLFKIFGNLVQ
jgi:dGTPase